MKLKTFLFTILSVTLCTFAFSKEVTIVKKGGKKDGCCVRYDYVSYTEGKESIRIRCNGKGPNDCPGGIIQNTDFDIVDVNSMNELIDYAENEILLGSLAGSQSKTIQVIGEDFQRVYNVVWLSDGDEEGNSEIKVTREDH
jgi:hypothetical protein